ncbi:MAG: hypothetical protein KGR68_18625, partial [Betaproteobacteria bacterium]|nr:hypothetical protein [Betaproteobacteria bacterium]
LSTSGNASVIAKGSVAFAADADIRTASTAAGSGSIDVWAETGAITQHASSVLASTGATAAARLRAATSVTIGDIELADGKVSITAVAGSVLDADALVASGSSSVNDADQDITAAAVRLNAGTALAQSVNHLETTAGTLSALAAGGGIWLLEADALAVDTVTATVSRVLSDGSVSNSTVTDDAQSDIRTTGANGSIVLRTSAGSLTLNNGTAPGAASTPADEASVVAHGSGNVLLQTLGAGTNIVANADVASTIGNISLIAKGSVTFAANADIRTASDATLGAASGSIDVWAEAGAITQDASSLITSTGTTAAARLRAATSVTVGDIELIDGKVSITAVSGSILDADALVTTGGSGANDSDQDITASGLRLSAGAAVGDSVNHLDTTVATLTALAANGSIWVLEANALTIGDVGLAVNRVLADASVSTADSTDAVQSDLRTTGGNGSIVVSTTAGSLTLTNGTAPGSASTPADLAAVSAHGSGNILLQAQGNNADLIIGAGVTGSTGHITLTASRTVAAGAGTTIATTGAGSVYLAARTGNLTMAADALISSVNGDVLLRAGNDVSDQLTIGRVMASNANVGLVSTGSVLDSDTVTSTADDSTIDVTARGLLISAGKGAGVLAGNSLSLPVNAIETRVETLSARVRGSDGLNLLEADQL